MRQPSSSRLRSALLALVLLTPLTACGSHGGGPSTSRLETAVGTPDCVLTSAAAAPGTVTVALQESVEPEHVPRPRNRAEAIVFRHLYESLLHVDCRGRIRPGLAHSWRIESGGRRWRFFLRTDARFWDGRPVTAEDVRTAWQLYGGTSFLASIGAPPKIRSIGERQLVVEWSEARSRSAPLFAEPALAVLRPSAVSPWPIGTGSYRPDPAGSTRSRVGAEIHLQSRATETGDRPALQFRVGRGGDGRDLLDRGADVLVTSDRATIEYAAALGNRAAIPLPWGLTHGLWIPGRPPAGLRADIGRKGGRGTSRLESLRQALARDVVPAEARPAADAVGHRDDSACDRRPVADPAPVGPDAGGTASVDRKVRRSGGRSVAYREGDEIGRALASRLVALLNAPPSEPTEESTWLREIIGAASPSVSVRAIPDSARLAADTERAHLAYVVSITPWSYGPCGPPIVTRPGGFWLPLVQTRQRLVVREGRATVGLGASGTLWFGPRSATGAAR